MTKKKKLSKNKEISCLNCGFPFAGYEVFCPECGQKNKNSKISFKNFIREMFAGFFSWDAKFWRTLFPLLFKPGKVSNDYIQGKRVRYTNPFRFYITMSVLFFLALGFDQTYKKYKNLSNQEISSNNNNNGTLEDKIFEELDKAEKKTDSLKQIIKNDSLVKVKDSTAVKKQLNSFKVSVGNNDNITSFIKFQKKNPTIQVDQALDSLHVEKTFSNRFWYSRSKIINDFISNGEEQKKFNNHLISYFSIALLFLLPILAFFLKIIYIRRGFTYVEHLVFTFHVQTVCFIILTLFIITRFFTAIRILTIVEIFSLLLLLYLYIAMKKFYKQRWFKTLLKFLLINFIFSILLVIVVSLISFLALALY